MLHCCGSDVPYRLFAAAGADAISVDAGLIRDADLDAIGTVLDQGVGLWLGVVPGTDTTLSRPAIQDRVRGLWGKLGFAPALLPERVVLSPSCGLAGASMPYVRKAMVHPARRRPGAARRGTSRSRPGRPPDSRR